MKRCRGIALVQLRMGRYVHTFRSGYVVQYNTCYSIRGLAKKADMYGMNYISKHGEQLNQHSTQRANSQNYIHRVDGLRFKMEGPAN